MSLGFRRALVTGAAGFVGANLAEALIRHGCEVHGLVRAGTDTWRLHGLMADVRLHAVDLVDRDGVATAVRVIHPDVVVHAAVARAESSSVDRHGTAETNILGTSNLLDAVAGLDLHAFVHLGSSLEYGKRSEPLRETDPMEPVTFYAGTKAAATLLALQSARANGLPVVVLRPFYVYGSGEPQHRLIPTVIRAACKAGVLPLTAPGYRHDYVFVDDVVDACILAAGSARALAGEIINVGSGVQTTNEEVVQTIELISGRPIAVRPGDMVPRRADSRSWVADPAKAARLLGWTPSHSLAEGLEKEIAWWLSEKNPRGERD